jgi:FXSXX-COOH protein
LSKTPLDEISSDATDKVVARVLRGEHLVPVDVAAFSSSI